ncbi:hypothetical protein A2477_02445 [Candidatus Falkowbacteria bacterium RIFOXYC2_FULL_47_12]|uniref:Lycopene cyclase domain-containing protein n=2 Tax=Candidatus Falkowiibacteriota TaxID=1752728 RepID=A0A1F5TMZ4_9BACT|nr:MAG: hypothetical protein A2242_00740 [Candidatus Falkowbacteria bacterium RIFOXYA2_FULL_47_9]OGF40149.1 MAG: hypothetical protein A2477_02445 [Candidatus Falkowbacteria bacterium RIFOXYC2_FULL_47_12]
MNYQYSYLIGSLALLVVWFALFAWRKDVRKEMLIISLLFGIGGVASELVYAVDWWHPLFIFNFRVGIEDFICGFASGGVAAVIYEEVFNKKMQRAKKRIPHRNNKNLYLPCLALILLFFGSFYWLHISSLYATFIGFFIPTVGIWIWRKDLIVNSLLSGLLLAVVSFAFLVGPELITPGWIAHTWRWENLSGITILKAPLEDIIWFFLAGMFIGPLYEFWQEAKLITKK